MKLRQFEFLCMLKEYGSISRVAEKSYTSQPAVSIAIKELETELGYPLLRRTNRGIQFTERGTLVLEQAEAIVRAVEQIDHISSCEDGALQGSLRAGALPHLCNTLLLNVQMELQELYPDFTLRLEGMETHTLVKMMERGVLDFIIAQECDFDREELNQKISQRKLHFEPLFEDELTFVVVEGHPLLDGRVILEDLHRYPFTAFGEGVNQCVMTLTQDTGYPDHIRRFDEMIRMRKFMAHYHGITVLPRRAIIHGNLNYRIKFVPLAVDGIRWTTRVGWMHQGKELTKTETVVIDHLVRQCSNPEFLHLI